MKDHARMRYSSDFAELGGDVLLTKASHSRSTALCPTGLVHGTDGDYGHGHDDGSGDESAHEGLLGEDALYAYCPDGGDPAWAHGENRRVQSAIPVRIPGVGMGLPPSGTCSAIVSTTPVLGSRYAARAAPPSSVPSPACPAA